MMIGRRARALPIEVRRPRLPLRHGLEGVPGDGRGLRHPAAVGPARERPPARADLHAGRRRRARASTTRTSRSTRRSRRWSADERRADGSATRLALYRHGAAVAPSGPGSSSPTPSSSSGVAARRRADPHRRGHDARFRRASGTPRRTSPAGRRRATTSSSSATGSRRGWDKRRPARRCRPTSSPGTRARYVEAFERITGASFVRYLEEDVIAR